MFELWKDLTPEQEIDRLNAEIAECQLEIQRIIQDNPRCPHCKKRYDWRDYTLYSTVDIKEEKWIRYLTCPQGHKIKVKDTPTNDVDMEELFEEMEELDDEYME